MPNIASFLQSAKIHRSCRIENEAKKYELINITKHFLLHRISFSYIFVVISKSKNIMKTSSIFLTILLCTTCVSAFAQTEQGKFRLSGTSSFGFSNTKYENDSSNGFSLNVNGGYFLVKNLSLDVGLISGYYWSDIGHTTSIGGNLGLRYYLPERVFFGALIDYTSSKAKSVVMR